MSLNKLLDYDKYQILNSKIKADKLGLKNAANNLPVCISNNGDKELISRQLTLSDLDIRIYGLQRYFFKQRVPKINIVNTADEVVPIGNTDNKDGALYVNGRDINSGDFVEFKASGTYTTNPQVSGFMRGIYVSISDGTNSQVFQVYSDALDPNPNYNEIFRFPEAPVNISNTRWDISIKIVKNGEDNTPNNVRLEVDAFIYGNGSSGSDFTACNFVKYGTSSLNFNNQLSFNFSWKYPPSGSLLSPLFQIYTNQSTISTTNFLDVASIPN